jgi:hypothetical protein
MGEKKKTCNNILSSVLKVPTETVAIDKKYHRHINMRLSLLNEAKAIEAYKSSYQQWYDTSKNSPTHSPIYSRVSHLLFRLIFS